MEDTLRGNKKRCGSDLTGVLILVLMEDTLREVFDRRSSECDVMS